MLSERKHTVLHSLIQEYVASAHLVASSTLVRHYLPRLSSATIRNELNWLEERGYVVSPHTSAGRMPTTVGYRSFVNSLLLHPHSYAAAPTGALEDFAAFSLAGDKVTRINEVLSALAEYNRALMVFWAPQLSSGVFHRGLPLLLSQPEFAETSAALPIMQLLESQGELQAIFEEVMETGGLHIRIGSEHRDTQLYQFSLIAMRFRAAQLVGATLSNLPSTAGKNMPYGVLALLGPTRMDYRRAIATVSGVVHDLERSEH